MPETLGFQIQRSPYGFRPGRFSCVGGKVKTMITGEGVDVAEKLGARTAFVASNTKAHDAVTFVTDGNLGDAAGFVHAKVANGVVDPEQRDAKVALAANASTFQAFMDGFKIELTQQTDADGNVNLGMEDVFGFQLLHQAV